MSYRGPRIPRCACCGEKDQVPGEVTCIDCKGWEELALDHVALGHPHCYPPELEQVTR